MPGSAKLLLDLLGQANPVEVVKIDIERLQPAQHRRSDPARGDRADVHAFDIVRAGDAISDVPAT